MDIGQHQSKVIRPKGPKRAILLLASLLTIAVVGVGVFAYLWQGQSSEAEAQRKVAENAKTNSALLRTQLDKANISLKEKLTETDTPAATAEDDPRIITMVGAYAHTRKGSESTKLDIAVVKKELPFARARVTTDDGGYACVLKKADDTWVVLFCGQGTPLQDELDQWGVPSSMLTS